jgi:hypothetical protein
MQTVELLKAAQAALAALETPGDLTEEEKGHVIEDLDNAIRGFNPGHLFAEYIAGDGLVRWRHSDGRTGTDLVTPGQPREIALASWINVACTIDRDATVEFHIRYPWE